jgi:hypothetical protein
MTSVGTRAVMESKEVVHPLIIDLLLEQLGKSLPAYLSVFQGVAKILGKRTFPRAEKARNPDANALVRLCWGFGNRFEKLGVLIANAICGNIFCNFLIHRLLVGLIDLDDLLDLAIEIPCQ